MERPSALTLFSLVLLAMVTVTSCGPQPFGLTKGKSTLELNPLDPTRLVPPKGKVLFYTWVTSNNTEIFVVNADGTNLMRLTNQEGFDDNAVWSPDGSKIAFTSTRFNNGWDICIMSADGTNVQRVTANNGPWTNSGPSWSPDGKQIVFQSDRDTFNPQDYRGTQQLYIINADGSELRRLTNDASVEDLHPSWSPDGTRIIFSSAGRIQSIDPDGKNRTTLAASSSTDYSGPAWSPDGRMIVFSAYALRSAGVLSNILIMRADGSDIHPLSDKMTPGNSPEWSPDMKHIVFDTVQYGGKYALYLVNADGTGVTQLTNLAYPSRGGNWFPK